MRKFLQLFVLCLTIFFCIFQNARNVAAFFSDVPTNHENFAAITWLQENEIVNGYDDGTFRPDQAVNRAEALKLIWESLNIEVHGVYSDPFFDVPHLFWFAPYVSDTKAAGIVEGNPDGSFAPWRRINLAETLKMIILANKVNPFSVQIAENPYADVSRFEWFGAYFEYAKNQNLLSSDSNSFILPGKIVTRAALSEIMYRIAIIQKYNLASFHENYLVSQDQILVPPQTPPEGTPPPGPFPENPEDPVYGPPENPGDDISFFLEQWNEEFTIDDDWLLGMNDFDDVFNWDDLELCGSPLYPPCN